MHGVRLLAGCLFLAACSGTSNPATTPAFVPTTTTAPSTTTTMETTTTLDRVAEIEAIYQDLEYRRLDALYRGDREAYASLFANDGYLQESMVLFDLVVFIVPPPPGTTSVVEILADTGDCVAMETKSDLAGIVEGLASESNLIVTLERNGGDWGISFVGGWMCDGTHPFSS